MKTDFKLSLSLLLGSALCQLSFGAKIENITTKPNDFVNIKDVIPGIQVDMRYFSDNNFVGKIIKGYQAPLCLLTKEAALGIKKVQDKLVPMGLSLKVYDCYRPQMAVNNFADWAKDIDDSKMKAQYYPKVDKKNLFSQGYIDYHSGHSRGSTVDLTIVPFNSKTPKYTETTQLVSCTAPKKLRAADNSLDFGTGFDCFSPVSHPDYQELSPQIKANRLLLQTLMMDAGFKPLITEWWHFTLLNEPYPSTYFNFPVE
ncbi:M15 family metallopeptidase [Caedibacter taeniospiralis]|jgi:D-alanyl-D-alanine dipeptidase|uniref:M15 family metallopeptidase n=1 Tax=Caedibacter taeniospiralis TaxID=28907 RepID=UPI0037BFB131